MLVSIFKDTRGRLHATRGPAVKREETMRVIEYIEDDIGIKATSLLPMEEYWIHGVHICDKRETFEAFIVYCALPMDVKVALKLLGN